MRRPRSSGLSSSPLAVQARHDEFIRVYNLNGGNGTKAAIAAGYSSKAAHVQGSQLVQRFNLKTAASERAAIALEKSGLDSERVLEELRRIAFADPRKLFNTDGSIKAIHDLDDDTAAAVASVDSDEMYAGRGDNRSLVGQSKKIRMWDKLGALDKAMRHLGLYERDNHQRENNLVINVGLVTAPAPKKDDE